MSDRTFLILIAIGMLSSAVVMAAPPHDFDYELQRYLMHQKLEREEQPVGTYAVSCWGFASRGQDHADCLRLNTKTGEMSLVNAHTISGSNHE